MEHLIIKLLTKRILLNFPLKLPELKSDFTLTLGYLNPALNNPALIVCIVLVVHGNTSPQTITQDKRWGTSASGGRLRRSGLRYEKIWKGRVFSGIFPFLVVDSLLNFLILLDSSGVTKRTKERNKTRKTN